MSFSGLANLSSTTSDKVIQPSSQTAQAKAQTVMLSSNFSSSKNTKGCKNTRLAINQRSELKASRQTQPKIEMAEIKPKTSNPR